jgi:AcrR family transcriptional regulator
MQILSAAEALLDERGFDQVSIRDIAERAGVKKALVFYYFGSREQLFDRVLERYERAHAEALASSTGHGGTPRERMRRVLEAYLDFTDTHPAFARLVLQELSRHGDAQMPQIRANLADLLRAMRAELGDFLPADGPLSASHVFVSLSAAIYNYHSYARVIGDLVTEGDPTHLLHERRAHVLMLGDLIVGQVRA